MPGCGEWLPSVVFCPSAQVQKEKWLIFFPLYIHRDCRKVRGKLGFKGLDGEAVLYFQYLEVDAAPRVAVLSRYVSCDVSGFARLQ